MNAVIKFSGVDAGSLDALRKYLTRKDLQVVQERPKRFVVLKDSRIEENKETYLVTVEVLLVDVGETPRVRMRLPLLIELFHAINSRLVPQFDSYGDAERSLEEFKVMVGKIAPFDVKEQATGLIILQKGQKIRLRRLEEIVGSKEKSLEWDSKEPLTEDGIFLNKLLRWRDDGGATNLDFNRYRVE